MSNQPLASGLSDKEVRESRQKNGSNILTPPKQESLGHQFFQKFSDPIIRILLFALAASIGIAAFDFWGENKSAEVFYEPAGIFLAVVLATGIGFWFEVKANRAFNVLNQVNDDEAVQVRRNGKVIEIAKKEIVVGDIVLINTGNEIPADGTLLEAVSLQVNESTLTGEPLVKKTTIPEHFDKEATYPSNHVLRGTTVVDGHGVVLIEKVGDHTENGKVFVAAQIDNSIKTPLNEQLDRLGKIITKVSYILAALIFIGRLITYFHATADFVWIDFITYLLQTLMIAITLIVVAVPEGLPMSVTLSLALSMRRMLKANNLVRKMHACETMGATTVICTDKTGTLTQNQMRISEAFFFDSITDKAIIAEGIAVNSTALLDFSKSVKPNVMGNPTEGALLLWLNELDTDYTLLRNEAEVVEQLTFSTERKYMATVVKSSVFPGKKIIYIKGAPEIVYALCKNTRNDISKETITKKLYAWQNQAMRTLGFAYQIIENDEPLIVDNKCTASNLTFLGITAIADPVRNDVPKAVGDCIDAGINIKIVTGDTAGTAREIARQIGLWNNQDDAANEITGPEFAALSDEDLKKRILNFKVISRARPMDKKRLVETLQELGQVVAVTGDGTNDAPALKAAQVGLSMGDGTSVAKEASDITIIDNSFASITQAVMWGRSLYQNIQRFILFQMTINVAACLIVLFGAFMGTQSPLTVTQMLWVNLIMDTFAAMALASLPPNKEVMHDKPRCRRDFIITSGMWKGIISTGIIFTALLLALLWLFETTEITSLANLSQLQNIGMDNTGLTPYEESVFFTIFVMLQFWNIFNAKAYATGKSAFSKLKQGQGFIFVLFIILIGQILLVSFGGEMVNVTPLSISDWITIILSTSVVLWIGEGIRLITK